MDSLEPYGFAHHWPRDREPQRAVKFTWTDSRGQPQTQTIGIGDPRGYRGKTIVYAFNGATWKAEAAPPNYVVPGLRPKATSRALPRIEIQ